MLPEPILGSAGIPAPGEVELSARRDGGADERVYFRSSDVRLVARPEACVSAFLLKAMRRGAPLRIDGSVPGRFSAGLIMAQEIYSGWFQELQPVAIETVPERSAREIEAADGNPASDEKGRTASFFTGGVDSFYTLLTKQEEIDTIVYVHGFDVALEDGSLRSKVSSMLQAVSSSMEKRLIEVETNFKSIYRTRLVGNMPNWPLIHGAALATTAHLLPDIARIYIPATHTLQDHRPLGSHPSLDPLWSTDKLEFIHDGCEADRIQKCAAIARSDLALQYLRVCWENPDSAYNCGRCEKCRRTMINLAAVGALESCRTFEQGLEPKDVARMRIRSEGQEIYLRQNLQHLRATGHHPELRRALARALRRHTLFLKWLTKIRRMLPQPFAASLNRLRTLRT